jgi:hypothetical protein
MTTTTALGIRSRILAALESEWGALFRALRDGIVSRRLAAIPMTLLATAAILVFYVVQHTAGGEMVVERIGVVQASLPLWQSLSRTPLSLFVPAPDLPVWGAALQVFAVFGIAEIALGRWLTLAVAYLGTLAGTLYARNGVRLGPEHVFGLPYDDAFLRDTGPSAAVVALAVCIAWRYRAWFTGGAVVVAMVGEEVLLPNMAGAEHMAAILCTVVIAGYGELMGRSWMRTSRAVRCAAALQQLPEKVRRTRAA